MKPDGRPARSGRWRIVLFTALSFFTTAVLGLATNLASDESSWPSWLSAVQNHPWVFLGIAAAAGIILVVSLTVLEVGADEPGLTRAGGTPTVLRTMPSTPLAFVDRQDDADRLIDRCRQILAAGLPLPVQALDGMPGVGKTAFATYVAHLLADDFPDGQIFMNLDGYTAGRDPVGPAEALASLLVILGVAPAMIPQAVDDQSTIRARSLMWRGLVADQRLVVVLDNVRDYVQVEPLIPEAPRSLVLVTSRRRLFELADSAHVLDVLPLTHATDLFVRLSGRAPGTLPRDRVETVVSMCGNLPLAVSLLAARFRYHSSWTVEDLIGRLTRANDRLPRYLIGEHGVSGVLDLSFDEFPTRRQDFFLKLGAFTGTDLDVPLSAALTRVEKADAEQELEYLHADHLLEETGDGQYRFHDLVRAYLVARLRGGSDAEQITLVTARAETYYVEQTGATGRVLGRGVPQAGSRSRDEALRWFEQNRGNVLAVLQTSVDQGHHETAVLLCAALSPFFQHTGPWDQAVKIEEIAVSSAQTIGDELETGRAEARLGVLHRLRADYGPAREALRSAAAKLAAVQAPADESFALNHLGIVEFMTSHYETAEQAQRQAQRQALLAAETAGDLLTRAGALHDLGMVLRVEGRYEEAEHAQTQALESFRGLGDTYGEANALRDLGLVSSVRGDYRQALRHHERALEIYRQLGDPAHQGCALNECGIVLRIFANLDESASFHAEALALYVKVGDRFGEANSLRYLGTVDRERGDLPSALARLRTADGIYAELGSTAAVAATARELGLTMHLLNRCAEADEFFAAARETPDRLSEAESLNAWASCLAARDPSRGEELLRTARESARTLGARLATVMSEEALAVLHGQGAELARCAEEYHRMHLPERAARAESRQAQFQQN